MLHKRKTILVIDDSSTIRAFVAGLLSKNGFQTLEAETMESVFADMARMHFDLAVIDIFMPGMGGIAGIAKVKECWPDIKIIAISAGVDGIQVSNHGARQFDGTPGAIDSLPSIVERVNGRVAILFDSGVRSGLDIIRALALGADFVLLGRAFLMGVAALGAPPYS